METDRQLPPRNAHRATAVDRVAQVLADRLPPQSLPGDQLQAAADAATSAVIQALHVERRYRVTWSPDGVPANAIVLADDARRDQAVEAAAAAATSAGVVEGSAAQVRIYARYIAGWRRIPITFDQPAQAEPAAA